MKACRALLIVAAATLWHAAPSRAQSENPPQTAPPPATVPLADPISDPIRTFDTLKVNVIGAAYLSGDFSIEKDGTLWYPATRTRFQAAGLTRVQLAEILRRRILAAGLLKRAEVGVSYVSRKPREASIGGAIQFPLRQILREGDLLSDVLGRAQPLASADLSRVALTRGEKRILVNYKRYTTGQEDGPLVNPKIEDGDRIFVPSGEQAGGNVRIRGEVRDTTKVILPILEGMTVGQALQSVGGITDLADKKGLYVQRGEERIPVPYEEIVTGAKDRDIKLLDKDELVVPRMERPRLVTVAGQGVIKQGPIPLIQGLTLADAIAGAGGFAVQARKKEVTLTRKGEAGKPGTLRIIDMTRESGTDIALQDGDIVSVDVDIPRQRGLGINEIFSALGSLAFLLSVIRR